MPQAGHFHHIRSLQTVDHPVEAVQTAGVVAGQVAEQGVEALARSQGILPQLDVARFTLWIACTDRLMPMPTMAPGIIPVSRRVG